MPTGTVKFFNFDKGFGFIQSDEGGRDVFVHVTGLSPDMPSPVEGMRVTFEEGSDRKTGKSKAVNVRPAGNDGH